MLCKEFLARNGGSLLIESKPEKGSVFSFTLPTVKTDG
jgi:signal transduction histidine kinase